METTIVIQNLKCGGCAATIKNKISALKGIENVAVNEEESTVAFTYPKENVLLEVKQKLAALGYPEMDAQNSLLTQAKSFVSCAAGRMSKS